MPSRRKLIEQVKVVEALASVRLTPGAITQNGTVVDRKGFLSCKAILNVGITTSASTANQDIEAVLYHNTTTAAASFSAYLTASFSLLVTAADTAGASASSVDELDLSGAARYIQLHFTGTNTTTGGVSASMAAVFILGDAINEPVSQ